MKSFYLRHKNRHKISLLSLGDPWDEGSHHADLSGSEPIKNVNFIFIRDWALGSATPWYFYLVIKNPVGPGMAWVCYLGFERQPRWVKEQPDRGTWCLPYCVSLWFYYLFYWEHNGPGNRMVMSLGVRKTALRGQRTTWSWYLMFTWAREPTYCFSLWFFYLVIVNTMGPGTVWFC